MVNPTNYTSTATANVILKLVEDRTFQPTVKKFERTIDDLIKQTKKGSDSVKLMADTTGAASSSFLKYGTAITSASAKTKAVEKDTNDLYVTLAKLNKETIIQSEAVVKAQTNWQKFSAGLSGVTKNFTAVRWAIVDAYFMLTALKTVTSPFVNAIKSGAEWEHQLRQILAVSQSALSSQSQLSSSILTARSGTPFGREEVGGALLEFAKLGYSTKDALAAIKPVMDLSVVGMVDLNRAVEITGVTLQIFNLGIDQTKRVVDTIATAANRSALSVETFGTALAYAGPIAEQLGISFEDTAAAITVLSKAGFTGNKAGTALRQVLSAIAEPTEKAKAAMNRLGIEFYTSGDKIKDVQNILWTLREALDGLSTKQQANVLGEMFEIRGQSAVSAFMNFLRTNNFSDVLKDLQDSSVEAQKIYSDSFNKMTQATKSFSDALLPISTVMMNIVTPIISFATSIIEKFNELSNTTKTVLSILGGLGGLVGGGFLGIKIYNTLTRGSSQSNPQYVYVTNLTNTVLGSTRPIVSTAASVATGVGLSGYLSKLGGIGSKITAPLTSVIKLYLTSLFGLLATSFWTVVAGVLAAGSILYTGYKINESGKKSGEQTILDLFKNKLFGKKGDMIFETPRGRMTASEHETLLKQEQESTTEQAISQKTKEIAKQNMQVRIDEILGSLVEKQLTPESKTFLTVVDKIQELLTTEKIDEGQKKQLEDYVYYFNKGVEVLEYQNTLIEEQKTKIDKAKKALEDKRNVEQQLTNLLSIEKSKLDDINDRIKKLEKPRFTGQTDIEILIGKAEDEEKKRKLASFGIIDAQKFLQDALKASKNGYDSLLTSIERVISKTKTSKDTYEAWKLTVQEFITSSLKAGQDLGRSVSNNVSYYSNLLLSTSKFEDSNKNESDSISLLKDAYDVYYGGMTNEVKYHVMAHEELKNGVFDTAQAVMSTLDAEWKAYDTQYVIIEGVQTKLDELRTKTIPDLETALAGLNTELDRMQSRYTSTYAGVSNRTMNLNTNYLLKPTSSSSSNILNSVLPISTAVTTNAMNSIFSPKSVTKFASGGLVNRPTLGLVGESGPEIIVPLEKSGSFGNITVSIGNITTNASANDAKQFAYVLAKEIKKELRVK